MNTNIHVVLEQGAIVYHQSSLCMPWRSSVLICVQLTYNFWTNWKNNVNFAKLNSLQTQFFSAIAKLKTREMCWENFCDREIKDSRTVLRKFLRNLSPAKIKENKVIGWLVSIPPDKKIKSTTSYNVVLVYEIGGCILFWQNRYNPEEMYTKRTAEKQK